MGLCKLTLKGVHAGLSPSNCMMWTLTAADFRVHPGWFLLVEICHNDYIIFQQTTCVWQQAANNYLKLSNIICNFFQGSHFHDKAWGTGAFLQTSRGSGHHQWGRWPCPSPQCSKLAQFLYCLEFRIKTVTFIILENFKMLPFVSF